MSSYHEARRLSKAIKTLEDHAESLSDKTLWRLLSVLRLEQRSRLPGASSGRSVPHCHDGGLIGDTDDSTATKSDNEKYKHFREVI